MKRTSSESRRIYLDYAATTPAHPDVVSEMVEGEIPEWFKSTSSTESASTAPEWVNPKPNTGPKSILRKCEHCGAVYSYAQKADDGLYICQNCGRPFKRGARDE